MHRPVMFKEVIELLRLVPGATVVDATLGGGGHAAAMMAQVMPGGRLIGLDADSAAIGRVDKSLQGLQGSYTLVHSNFRDIKKILQEENIAAVDAVLFDIGLSSFQLDGDTRGFSFKSDARLDMRMNMSLSLTAYDIVNRYREDDIADIIYNYGEERLSRRIARAIVEERKTKPIETTLQLSEIIHKAVAFKYRKSKIDASTRTFQALRIAVNDELAALEEGVRGAVDMLKPAGRVVVISFHSLEDRIVKTLFKEYAANGILRIITKKPLRPQDEEAKDNPRSRSARLRAAERT